MKYFLDSAKIDEIRYAYENWGIDGVTTNPKHILSSGKPFGDVIEELAKEFEGTDFPISVEVNPHLTDPAEIIDAAKEIATISKNFVIKVACNEQGLTAVKKLSEKGVKTNVTLVFSPSQALQAGRIGATFVSPFIGWKEASGEDCTAFLDSVVMIYQNYDFSTEIIVAAVQNGKQITEAAYYGAHIVTARFSVYKDSFEHPFTDKGIEIFSDCWDKTKGAGA